VPSCRLLVHSSRKPSDSFRGKIGGFLQVVNTERGEKIKEKKLDYLPAFDGMAAARNRLFVVSQDGELVCYE
jgi:hypothetical protein